VLVVPAPTIQRAFASCTIAYFPSLASFTETPAPNSNTFVDETPKLDVANNDPVVILEAYKLEVVIPVAHIVPIVKPTTLN
jgi:hypothetical protein